MSQLHLQPRAHARRADRSSSTSSAISTTGTTRTIRATVLSAIAIGTVIAASTVPVVAVQASGGTSYFIDNRSGSGCSDAGPGTDEATPWCSFAAAADLTLGAGDSLLLARGASWSEQLTAAPRGDAGAPATVGAYGTGPAPRILYNDTSVGVVVSDANHAVIRDLDIGAKSSTGTSALSYGLMADYSTVGNTDVTYSDISVHDNRVVGLFVRNTGQLTMAQSALDGLTISRVATTHNGHGVTITNQGAVTDRPAGAIPGQAGANVFTNVLVEGLRQSNDDNNNPPVDEVFSQIDAGCPDSLGIMSSSHVVIRDSILDGSAACRTGSGTAAIFLGNVEHVLVANNVLINTPNTMNPDMVAIDYEATTADVTLAGNYFADNYGGAVEFLAIHGAEDFSTGHHVTSNVFVENGVSLTAPYPGEGAISQLGNGVLPDATISDNIAYEPHGLVTASLNGSTAGFTVANNIGVGARADVFSAAAQYEDDGTPWTRERSTGSGWSSLPYDAASDGYSDGDVLIDRFSVSPGATSDAAISWTAPRDGVVSLRGYPLAHTGTASVFLTVNGSPVASALVGTDGSTANADGVSVSDGDVIRFIVAAGGPAVSWAPAVAYTSEAVSNDGAGEWTFSVAGDAQGWSSSAPATIQNGLAVLETGGGTTTVRSADGLALSAAESTSLQLRYYNTTSAASGRVYFTNTSGEAFSEAKSVAFSINPRVTSGVVEGFHTVVVPLTGNPAWTGGVERLGLAFDDAAGTVAIDSIRLTSPAAGWEFSTADGWTMNPDAKCASTGTPSTGATVDVENSAGPFANVGGIEWNNTRMQTFRLGTPRLAQVDLWALKSGAPHGCLFLRVVKITDPVKHRGETLFTGAVPPSAVSEGGNIVSVYPGLDGLDTAAMYGLQIFNPYTLPGSGSYGVAYSDDPAYAGIGEEFYSVDNNGTWNGPETNRSLAFRTYTAPEIAEQPANPGFVAVTTTNGVIQGGGGYEPVLLSPSGLGIAAEETDTIHIRMSNPDNRLMAYLLFTTDTAPSFDQPNDGAPIGQEIGGKSVAIALVPGPGFHEYTIDTTHISGWSGTIEQLKVQPGSRWNYRIGDVSSTWTGAIDSIRFGSASAASASAGVRASEQTGMTRKGDHGARTD